MSACLPRQLIVPTKPATHPLLFPLPSPGRAERVRLVTWGAQGGIAQTPWATRCPGGKIPQGNWSSTGSSQGRSGSMCWGQEQGLAMVRPPTQTSLQAGAGGTSQICLWKRSSLCAKQEPEVRGCTVPQPQLCRSGVAAAGCQAWQQGTDSMAHSPPPGGCWLPAGARSRPLALHTRPATC